MQKVIFHGLATCETCRRARRALESAGRDVVIRDVRAAPLTADERGLFLMAFGDRLINRASTTWRGLDDAARMDAPDTLLARYPALMRRPVIEAKGRLWLGWTAAIEAEILA
jgi:arsenate reductase